MAKHNIVAIFHSYLSLRKYTNTLLKFTKQHNCKVHVLIVEADNAKRRIQITFLHSNIFQIYAIKNFDYSKVTQANVNALRSVIDELKPSLAIIPSFKISRGKLGVLAKSALLACRPIGSIIMYGPTGSRFKPSVLSVAPKRNQKPDKRRVVEAFESQRIILLGDVFS